MADREFLLRIVGDTSGAQKALGDVEQKTSGFASAFKGAAAAIAASAVVDKVVEFGTAAVTSASDVEQSLGGSQQIFGKYAGGIEKFSKSTAENMGISQGAFLEMSNVTGSLLKNAGTPLNETSKMTKQLTGRAADMAAMFGGDVDTALGAINSALKGEMDPLENFGVSLKASKVEAKAVAMGLVDGEGKATDYGKSMAAVQLIMEQSADSAGTFKRESDTLAGRQAILKARFADMQAELGQKLLPIINAVAGFLLDDFIPAMAKVSDWIQRNWPPIYDQYIRPTMVAIQDIIETVTEAIQLIWRNFGRNIVEQVKIAVDFIKGHIRAGMRIVKGILDVIIGVLTLDWKRAWKGLQGIVGGVIDGLIGEFKLLLRSARNILGVVWKVIAAPIQKGVDKAKDIFDNLTDWVKRIPERFVKNLRTIWKVVSEPFKEGYERIRDIVLNMVDWFRDLPDRIARTLRNIWRGMVQPFKDGYTAVRDVIAGMVDWFRGLPDRIGSAVRGIWRALVDPVKEGYEAVRNVIAGMVDWFRNVPFRIGNVMFAVWRSLSQPFREGVTSIKTAVNSLVDWFRGLAYDIGRVVSNVADAITAPFRYAFDGIKNLWNQTIGGFGFSIPSWVPGVGGKSFKIPYMAQGGIITRPTIAMLGEAGPEAVIPLRHGGADLVSGGSSVTINVYALTASAEVGRKVYESLREYQRVSGKAA